MNDSHLRQLVLSEINSIEERSGDLESVKERGRRRRVATKVTTLVLGIAATAGILAVVLARSPTTAIAADSYPPDQRDELIACLSEYGFESIPQDDGSVWVEHTNAERDNVHEAIGICIDRVEGRSTATDAEIRAEYEARLAERECLVEAGYEVAPPPSWETFRAQYGDGVQDNDWLPIEHVTGEVPHEELHHALDACQPMP